MPPCAAAPLVAKPGPLPAAAPMPMRPIEPEPVKVTLSAVMRTGSVLSAVPAVMAALMVSVPV
ncbi:MAG: hypothetical protein U1F43_18490 [Myxococcota bacterium]